MKEEEIKDQELRLANSASRAVGISKSYWFVALVRNNTEVATAQKLEALGYEAYVPTQDEIRKWRDGRRIKTKRILIKNIVFIHTTERERKVIVNFPFVQRFMTDRARKKNEFNNSPIATVPDEQIDKLKYMLRQSDDMVTIESTPLVIGDKVRVTRGQFFGLEGNIIENPDGKTTLIVELGILGCAKVQIKQADIEKIPV